MSPSLVGRISVVLNLRWVELMSLKPGNTKRGSITIPLTSCLTGLELAGWQLTNFVFICKTV